jgi:hypothetical protein
MAWLPIVDGGGNWAIIADGAPATGDTPTAEPQQITPNFFASLSIPVLRGRDFSDADRATTEPVVVVNQALAKRLWQTDDVLGRKFRLSTAGMPSMTVVGVVANTRVDGLTEPAPPIMYFPHQQANVTGYFTALSMSLVVRTSAASFDAIVPAIKQAVRALDTNVPVSEIRTIGDIVSSSIGATDSPRCCSVAWPGLRFFWPPSASTASSHTASRNAGMSLECEWRSERDAGACFPSFSEKDWASWSSGSW